MKWNYVLLVLTSVFLINVLADNNKKESLQQKHKQDKPHKQPSLQHWDDEHYGPKQKMEHHNVKDVQKHAPLTVSHHEAKMQVNLGHTNKKQLDRSAASKSDMKLQDLAAEDLVHHKSQSHKSHNGRDNHGLHSAVESGSPPSSSSLSRNNQHKVAHVKNAAASGNNNNNNNNRHATLRKRNEDDEERKGKPAKKSAVNKFKKAKRTKRLHKQYIF